MTQGYEANHSGAFLENTFRREMMARGFLFRPYVKDMDNFDMFSPRVVVCRVPYYCIFKYTKFSEFVINDGGRKIRVECRWQSRSGSIDEKFPSLIDNMIFAPELEALILYGGDGAKKEVIEYAKEKARQTATKKIHVVNINEFPLWVKREFATGYNKNDDFAKSLDVGYEAIRDRIAQGGPGWTPKTRE